MSFTKITNAEMQTHGVRGLPDTPNLSAYDMQVKFDELATDVLRPAHDRLIDELEDTTAASSIGAEVPAGMVAQNNVQSILERMGTSSHTHANKEVLDKFSEDEEKRLLYDGKTIASKSFAKIIVGDQVIEADIDSVLNLLGGENVSIEANPTDNTLTISMENSEEYVYVRYSASADGSNFVENPTSKTPFMGIAITFESVAPTEPSAYKWILTGIETQDVPKMTINWETGELEYSGTTYTFFTDENGYLHWGVE